MSFVQITEEDIRPIYIYIYIYIYIILHEEFDYGIYICQTTYFDPFWITLGVSRGGSGVKKVKNCLSL